MSRPPTEVEHVWVGAVPAGEGVVNRGREVGDAGRWRICGPDFGHARATVNQLNPDRHPGARHGVIVAAAAARPRIEGR